MPPAKANGHGDHGGPGRAAAGAAAKAACVGRAQHRSSGCHRQLADRQARDLCGRGRGGDLAERIAQALAVAASTAVSMSAVADKAFTDRLHDAILALGKRGR